MPGGREVERRVTQTTERIDKFERLVELGGQLCPGCSGNGGLFD